MPLEFAPPIPREQRCQWLDLSLTVDGAVKRREQCSHPPSWVMRVDFPAEGVYARGPACDRHRLLYTDPIVVGYAGIVTDVRTLDDL
jgi:hypothetical protein